MEQPKPPYRYSLKSIELREVHINQMPVEEEAASGLNFNVNLENLVNEENGFILSQVMVTIATQRSAVQVGKITTALTYFLAEHKSFLEKNDQGMVSIPPDLLAILNGIAISTTRGMMFDMFKGTPLHGAILPLLDVKSFAPELPLPVK